MQHQFNNPNSIPLIANSGISTIGAQSNLYDVRHHDTIAFTKKTEFADVMVDYQLNHHTSESASYNHHANEMMSSSPFHRNSAVDYHDRLLTNLGYDEHHSRNSGVDIDYRDSTINHRSSLDHTDAEKRSDQNIDGYSRHDEVSDASEETLDSTPSENLSDVEAKRSVDETVDDAAVQHRISTAQNTAEEDAPFHLALVNVTSSDKSTVDIKQKAGTTKPISLDGLTAYSKTSSSLTLIDSNLVKVTASSHETSISEKDHAFFSKQANSHSSHDLVADDVSDAQTVTANSVSTKKTGSSSLVSLNNASDQTPAIHESIRYSLIDGRTIKAIDPTLSFTELNAKDQPVVLREFRQFLDDIGNDSIVKHARLVIRGDQHGELRLLIKPPELGVMRIRFSLHQNTVEGKFIVDNILAKDVMERNIPDIQRHLRDNGLESRGIEVSLHNNANDYSTRSSRFGFNVSHNTANEIAATPDTLDDSNSHMYMKKNNTALIDLLA